MRKRRNEEINKEWEISQAEISVLGNEKRNKIETCSLWAGRLGLNKIEQISSSL